MDFPRPEIPPSRRRHGSTSPVGRTPQTRKSTCGSAPPLLRVACVFAFTIGPLGACFDSRSLKNDAPQPKPIPIPALLVYGKPTSSDVPQASWFPAEDRPTVAAAAQSLKFSVLEIRTEAEKALIVSVHEGVLKGNSRMIVGSVTPEVYKRIEDYVAKASPAPAAASANEEAARTKPSPEQNKNIPSAGGAVLPPAPSSKAVPDSPTQVACDSGAGRKKRDRAELA